MFAKGLEKACWEHNLLCGSLILIPTNRDSASTSSRTSARVRVDVIDDTASFTVYSSISSRVAGKELDIADVPRRSD